MHMDWRGKFAAALGYDEFLTRHAAPQHGERWKALHGRVSLAPEQTALLRGFVRRMNVLCLAGAWCGDCVNQCPIFQRFAEATDKIDLRFLDRDEHADVQAELSLCGGNRVPVVVFLSEDFTECGRYGDRTLAKYREMARTQLGPACPTGIGAPDRYLLAAVTGDWLGEFERVQLMLRLSARLRDLHGD
jgi:thiol-disulfide isomerase/thioredoxin